MIGFYDNVVLRLWGDYEVTPYLDNVTQIESPKWGYMVVGGKDGLKVVQNERGLKIMGSLAKFLNDGSNIVPLEINSMQEALEKLNDGLHLDFSVAQVSSVEFGTQFLMKEAVSAYLCRLGFLARFTRSTLSEGNLESLYYQPTPKQSPKPTTKPKQPNRSLKFYDKGQEARLKGMKLPDQWCHLLKYELTLRRQYTKLIVPNAADLCDKENYRRLALLWRDLYYKIEKQKTPIMNEVGKKLTSKTFYGLLSSFAIGQLDKDFVLGFIENAKAMGMERKELYRLKQLVKKATSDSVSDELMRELDDCIDNAVAYL